MGVQFDAIPAARFGPLMQVAVTMAGVGLAIFLIAKAVSPAYAPRPPASGREADFRAYLDRAAPRLLHRFGVPGVVVSTVLRGAPGQTYAYGYADPAHGQPMTPDTVFRVASLSKSLTAWGVLRLVQTGKIDLDAPVARYLSRWPLPPSAFPKEAVTVRRLLNHTAGLNAGEDGFQDPARPAAPAAQLLATEGDRPGDGGARLVGPAGVAYAYSAPGYTLLQMLIEDRTGQPFAQYMKTQVLGPLGMTASSFEWEPPLRPRTAAPFLADGTATALTGATDTAADALYSTGPDMARFVAAPLPDDELPAGANVLAPGMMRPMFTAARLPTVELQGLSQDGPGLGCFIERLSEGSYMVMNGGADPGWSVQYYIVPRTGDGIVVLTNSDAGLPVISEILGAWTAWRGLPPVQVTRAHYVVRLDIAVLLGLVMLIALRFGARLIAEFAIGARRVGRFLPRAAISNVIEAMLAIALIGAWVNWRTLLQGVAPAYYNLGTFAISLFAVVTLARLIFPRGWEFERGGARMIGQAIAIG